MIECEHCKGTGIRDFGKEDQENTGVLWKIKRQPIQIFVVNKEYATVLYGLCNDGTIWEYSEGTWSKKPNIPTS